MTDTTVNSWLDVQSEVLARIHSRKWKPGELIPNEAELAVEFGCARATVNRALQAVADAGWLDRRRKAGTRVAMHPQRKAVLNIPIIRKEIEELGKVYSHKVLHRALANPLSKVAAQMKISEDREILEIHTLHFADETPYAFEERWINTGFLPEALNTDFTAISVNEWLVSNAPLTEGRLSFSATNADDRHAGMLGVKSGSAILRMNRTTWHNEINITLVTLLFAPGYQLDTLI
ncbi:MAG: UTRA domain-containing protein [Pseudomonadota bacterium]